MKKFFAILFASLFMFKPNYINAEEIYKIYYLEDNEKISFDEYIFLKECTEKEKIELLLNTYVYNAKNHVIYIPEDTKILDLNLINKDLYINFNENILNYGGGSYYETNLIRLILHICFQFNNIDTVTFLIENKFMLLPESSLVYKYTRQDLEILDYNQSWYLKENINKFID